LHWKNDAQALVKTEEIFGGGARLCKVIHFPRRKRNFAPSMTLHLVPPNFPHKREKWPSFFISATKKTLKEKSLSIIFLYYFLFYSIKILIIR
jgi:hypothetical protein